MDFWNPSHPPISMLIGLDRVEQLEAKVKALETLTLPLQGFELTNEINQIQQAVRALTERLDAMETMGKVGQ